MVVRPGLLFVITAVLAPAGRGSDGLHVCDALTLLQTKADVNVADSVLGVQLSDAEMLSAENAFYSMIADNLTLVDGAIGSVDGAVRKVNDTTIAVLSSVVDAGSSLSAALTAAKASTEEYSSILGEEAETVSARLYERLAIPLESQTSDAADAEERLQAVLLDIVREFGDAGANAKSLYSDATKALRQAETRPRRASSTSALLSIAAERVSWNSSAFYDMNTPCGKARQAVVDADRSVDHMQKMMKAANTTLYTGMLEGARENIITKTSMLREELSSGVKNYASELPSVLLATVTRAVEHACITMEIGQENAESAKQEVSETLSDSMLSLMKLHGASLTLTKELEKVCNDE